MVPHFMNSFNPQKSLSYCLSSQVRLQQFKSLVCEKPRWPSTCLSPAMQDAARYQIRKWSLLWRLPAHLLVEPGDTSHAGSLLPESRCRPRGRLQLARCQPAGGDA